MFIPRTLAELDRRPGHGNAWRAIVTTLVVAVSLFLILSANITLGQEDLQEGQIAERDIRAQRDATFDSPSLTAEARQAASDDVVPQTVNIKPPADNLREQLALFDAMSRRVERILGLYENERIDRSEAISRLMRDAPQLSMTDRLLVIDLPPSRWEAIAAASREVLATTLTDRIREDQLVAMRSSVRELVTAELETEERRVAGNLAAAFVAPTEAISEELTALEQSRARSAVAPVVVSVRQGERIVAEGERITLRQVEILEELGLTRPRVEISTVLGNALMATILAGLLVAYLWRFEPEVWHRNRSVLLFFLALVVSAIALRVAADRTLWAFAVPTSASVLLMAVLLRSSAGAAMAGGLAILAGVMNRDALDLSAYVLAGGIASLLVITRAERLNAFIRVFAALALTNVAVTTAFSLLAQSDVQAILQLGAMGLVNAFLSVVLALGSFHLLGNVFGIMTIFQLLELANPSNRLLRRLLLETPGTYHHSVMVGNLAERAAETIGADPLLARVAAYYHDIGKMKNPLAFIENQGGSHNIHDDLTAETSARIIAGHIRDGIDLGYEHGLPVQIIGFIPQHHGTSVMTYFHGKALREVRGNEELVDERTFRYPGPKPQSREAAILMLADGVEASVRSLDEKDEESIRAMVDRIVDARLEDGQLDDAELTLKNVAQIKDAFVGQLLGMYHSRIKYPDNVVPMEGRREQA
ncbi:MAG TPA: HDIG domain-containing protein [Candidatus Limnocylindrales bacterium]|nr:HDIG domain-containing protein [Candidatus Limnocylindrales bacterium]